MLNSKITVKEVGRKYGTVLFALIVFILFSFTAKHFYSLSNFMLLLRQMTMLTIISLGFTFVMAAAGFDMSIGFSTGFVGIVFINALLVTDNFWVALIVAIITGGIIGSVNGLLVAYVGLPDFIGTFAVGSIMYGLKMLITRGNPTYVEVEEVSSAVATFRFIGQGFVFKIVPFMVIIMVAVIIIAVILLGKTKLGRRIYAIGGNREAALYAGINVKKYKFITFVISGIAVALTAVLLTSRLNSAQPTAGENYLMDAISVVFLSTTMFGEGEPTALGTVIGAFIISMLNNGLTMLGVTYYFQYITTGVVVILAVLLSVMLKRNK